MAAAPGVARSRFVVVGGGIAGVTCAEKVRAGAPFARPAHARTPLSRRRTPPPLPRGGARRCRTPGRVAASAMLSPGASAEPSLGSGRREGGSFQLLVPGLDSWAAGGRFPAPWRYCGFGGWGPVRLTAALRDGVWALNSARRAPGDTGLRGGRDR